MKPKVYVTLPIAKEVEQFLAEHCDVREWKGEGAIRRDRLLQELKDVDGLLTGGRRITENLLNHAPKLKVVSNVAVGYNNFDLEAMKFVQ